MKVTITDTTDIHYSFNMNKNIFEYMGTVGDKILLMDELGYFIEVYPRKCKAIIDKK